MLHTQCLHPTSTYVQAWITNSPRKLHDAHGNDQAVSLNQHTARNTVDSAERRTLRQHKIIHNSQLATSVDFEHARLKYKIRKVNALIQICDKPEFLTRK